MKITLLGLILLPLLGVARADPVMDRCGVEWGCPQAIKILDPCGGGATNSSLQQNLVYSPTPILGSCECNSDFFNAFSSCLACISSQGKNSPEIQNQQDWVANCKSYGFNFTQSPINFTMPTNGNTGASGGGLSGGAIAGIVIGILALAALVGAWFFLKHRRKRTKASIFQRPYTSASSGTGSYAPAPELNTYSNYHNNEYPESQDYEYQGANPDDMVLMENLNNSNYIPPPVPMSPSAVAAVANPRPGDAFPQSLRSKPLNWEEHHQELTSGLVSGDHLLYNDKAVYEDGEDELEPPRSRDRFANDRDDYSNRRSLTPPRANMRSYGDDFSRPSFEREPRHSGSERGSISGMNIVRSSTPGNGGGYTSGHESNDEDRYSSRFQDSPESARRRERAAELFAAEGIRR